MLRSLIIACVVLAGLAAVGAAHAASIPTRDVDLEVTATDGVLLRGIVALPDPEGGPAAGQRWPVAILVPAQFGRRSALLPLVDALARAGIASVLLDPRGQGDSMTTREHTLYSGQLLPPGYLRLAAGDQAEVVAALSKMPELDLSRLALVGVAQGALVAAAAAATLPAARALVMVDTVESLAGLSAERSLGLVGMRPALLLCSGFPVSKERATALAEYGLGERTVRCVGDFFNGAALLAEDRPALGAVAEWLTGKLAAPPATAPAHPPPAAPEQR
ncbi:MAG: dienelactone hydrolase family protein [Acidobacteria bacterium]|nr:dienelactone hydrolase family protein [Acidobacteriota bacterium]